MTPSQLLDRESPVTMTVLGGLQIPAQPIHLARKGPKCVNRASREHSNVALTPRRRRSAWLERRSSKRRRGTIFTTTRKGRPLAPLAPPAPASHPNSVATRSCWRAWGGRWRPRRPAGILGTLRRVRRGRRRRRRRRTQGEGTGVRGRPPQSAVGRFSTSRYLHPATRSQRSARVTAHRLSHPAGPWDTASGPPIHPQQIPDSENIHRGHRHLQTCGGSCPSANGAHGHGFLWPCSRPHSTKATWSPRGCCFPFWGVCLQEGGLGPSLLGQRDKEKTGGRWVPRRRPVPRPLQRSPLWEIPSSLPFPVLVDVLVLAAEGGITAGRQKYALG
ncbi:uncharacterized protein LOC123930058 [Meles meles]|uniref:uncharacterized protein LOC123930058 n=1 Tax=Meles meles TaxID=9662 RepID=UPI001E69984D|nr:uncharacterized protein LOC123930058 [Meles meles]